MIIQISKNLNILHIFSNFLKFKYGILYTKFSSPIFFHIFFVLTFIHIKKSVASPMRTTPSPSGLVVLVTTSSKNDTNSK